MHVFQRYFGHEELCLYCIILRLYMGNFVTYKCAISRLIAAKRKLQNTSEPGERATSRPSERTPPLARGSACSLARCASERANTFAHSARDSEIFGSALVSSAGSLGSASRLGSMPTLVRNVSKYKMYLVLRIAKATNRNTKATHRLQQAATQKLKQMKFTSSHTLTCLCLIPHNSTPSPLVRRQGH